MNLYPDAWANVLDKTITNVNGMKKLCVCSVLNDLTADSGSEAIKYRAPEKKKYSRNQINISLLNLEGTTNMKNFLSEYGFAILAAIVVILLIAMCTPVGNLIKNQIMGVVDGFATKTESKLYTMDAGNEAAVIVKQLDDAGKFSITATSDSETDVLKASYRVKDQHGN